MRTIRILVTLLLICASASFAQTTSSPTVAFVYLGGRETEHPVRAFSLQANGSAHLVPGSPFTTAALTSGSPQTIVAASTNFVFASDTENIATFRRSTNGALTFISSVNVTPNVATIDTLTLDRTASNLYAGGGRFTDTHYFVFNKGTQGQLTAASELSVQADGELQFEHNNKFAYTTYQPFLNLPDLPGNQYCTFEAYSRTADGSLNPFDPALSRPSGVAASDFCPASAASSALGYVALAYRTLDVNRFVGTGVHSIAVYRILSSGDLQFVSKLVTTLDAVLPVTMKFDPSGAFLAVAGKQGIQLYKLSSGGTLTKSGPPLYTHTNFRDVRWDRSGHVITISFGAVYFFGLKNGQLVQTNAPIYISFAGIRDLKVVSLQ